MSRNDDLKQTSRDRKVVVQEAGWPTLSFPSILAGTLTGYGAFAIIAALIAALLSATDVDTDFSTNDWASSGAVGGLATGVALLLAYLFGGYVAGRMARRSGLLHGAGVALLSIIGGGIAGAVTSALADRDDIDSNLASIGVPTTWDGWSAVTVTTAIVAVAALVVGSVVGAMYGERWHSRLLARAADPERGRSADARRRADELEAERDRLVQSDVRPVGASTDGTERERQDDTERERLDDRERELQDDMERERQRRADLDGRETEQRAIDLRDNDEAGQPSEVDEPRYTADEWEAMRRAERRSDGS